ncbi:hypothetical protein Tco_0897378 [Tanacetum coccineum]
MPQPMQNPEDSSDPTTVMNNALALMAKAFKLNTSPTNNNQRSSLIPHNSHITQPDMNTSQDIKMQMVDDNVGNHYGNGNIVTVPNEGNGNGINGNPIRCYNYRGEGHYASNCTVKSRKRDAAYLQQQLQIAQEEEAGIQSTQEEFEFMTAADAHEETKRVKLKCTSEDTMQQASTSRIQSDNAPIYDSDGSAELNPTKQKLEACIIKKEKEYATLLNNWYKKCEECKYDKISYDKDYNDMQTKIERLQTQLGDLKGKSSDTQCSSNTLDQVSQKLKDENMSLASQVLNYAKENAHLKTTYKNMFDSIKVTQAQTTSIIDSLQKQLYDTIYENAKLRAQLFDKVSEQKGTTKGMRMNTMFTKQSILGKPPSSSYKPKLFSVTHFPKSTVIPKVGKSNALSKLVNSNSAPSTQESKVMQTVNKHKANVRKSKELGSKGSLASSRPNKPRTYLRWIPTGRIFAMCGKLTASSNTENKSDKSVCDNAITSNPSEPSSKGFSNSTSLLGRLSRLRKQHTSTYLIAVL